MFSKIFPKKEIPSKLPRGMENLIEKLKKSKNKKECVKAAYNYLSKKYRGHRVYTYLRIYELFTLDLNKMWHKKGFLHCNNINYLMRILLIKSGFFSDKDIELKWTLVWFFSPHQYLKVRLNNKEYINIDLWAKAYGIRLGDYLRGFN